MKSHAKSKYLFLFIGLLIITTVFSLQFFGSFAIEYYDDSLDLTYWDNFIFYVKHSFFSMFINLSLILALFIITIYFLWQFIHYSTIKLKYVQTVTLENVYKGKFNLYGFVVKMQLSDNIVELKTRAIYEFSKFSTKFNLFSAENLIGTTVEIGYDARRNQAVVIRIVETN